MGENDVGGGANKPGAEVNSSGAGDCAPSRGGNHAEADEYVPEDGGRSPTIRAKGIVQDLPADFLNLNILDMKKLTKEEVAKLVVRKGKSTRVRTEVMNLQPGEFLLIEKSDWKQKNGPGQMLSRLMKKTGMQFRLQTVDSDGGGWIVERIQ